MSFSTQGHANIAKILRIAMPRFDQYPQRDFSPVDNCDVRFESPRSSHSRLLAKPPRESDEEKGHHYEDPSVLSDQVRVHQGGEKRPRKRYNDMYEPHIPLKELRMTRSREISDCSDLSDTYARESCLNRCILFFVLLTSVTALILVVLLMLGKVGPSGDRCACANTEQGRGNDGEYKIKKPRGLCLQRCARISTMKTSTIPPSYLRVFGFKDIVHVFDHTTHHTTLVWLFNYKCEIRSRVLL